MRVRGLVLAATLLVGTTACGSDSVSNQSSAAIAAEAKCQSRFDRQFHVQPGQKTAYEGFVADLGNGRFRVTGNVPVRAGQADPESYTCVVMPGSSGLRIARFDVTRAP